MTPSTILDSALFLTLASMAIGALVTWWAARWYYVKASRELTAEAKELRRLNVLMLRGLESTGLAEFARDDAGNITGMMHRASGNLVGGVGSVSGNAANISKAQKS